MDFSHNGDLRYAAPTPSPPPAQNGHHHHTSSPNRGGSSNLTSGTNPLAQQLQSQPQLSQLSYPLPYTPHAQASASTFRAPAHKHAHHLHSIPPREKSTRTLIIDHLLWVHARTRFAQARAELAMTDRTGGPGAPNYAHRERPEQWDEEEEVPSDGEYADVGGRALRARLGGPDHSRDGEEAQITRQDLPFARRLRQRAEALEKVVTGMLEQPPRDYPFPEDEPIAPTPPQQQPLVAPPSVGKHVLPNGVRLRLALTMVINDLFARQAPLHRHLYSQAAAAAASSSSASRSNSGASSSRQTIQTSSTSSPSPLSWLPQSLVPLLFVSCAATAAISTSSPYSPFNAEPSPRARDMFVAGADPSTANSPSFLRCPRHLHQACEICVDSGLGAPSRPRGGSRSNERTPAAQGGGISGFAEGAGVGGGLARPGPGGTLLRRWIPVDDARVSGASAGTGTGDGNTRLAELIPRFVRLSALVALELGREVGTEETDPGGGRAALAPTAQWYLLLASLLTRAVLEGYLTAGWTGLAPVQILLSIGLGSTATPDTVTTPPPAADDEYVEFEPDGMPDLTDAVDVLFPSRGASRNAGGGFGYESGGGGGGEGSGSSSRSGSNGGGRGGGEAEYAREMGQRLAQFLDVPAGTPNLSTHLEELAWQYPAEPIERAALRFCEALARWRGKPELETYKKRSPAFNRGPVATPAMLESGIASAANGAVRRAIGRYFVIPDTTATTTTAVPADVLVPNGYEEVQAVVGRKRAHSMSGATGAASSNGSAGAGDRWGERRGYV